MNNQTKEQNIKNLKTLFKVFGSMFLIAGLYLLFKPDFLMNLLLVDEAFAKIISCALIAMGLIDTIILPKVVEKNYRKK